MTIRRTSCTPAQVPPLSLSACLRELAALDAKPDEPSSEVWAVQRFLFDCLATIPPQNGDEAIAVFDYLEANGIADLPEAKAVMRNLIAGNR